MPNQTVSVTLQANVAGFQAAMGKAAVATDGLAKKLQGGVAKNEASINRLSNTAGVLGLAIGAPIAAAVRTFAAFDKAMSGVAATGSDARKNLDALRKSAISAGSAFGFTATESASGIEALLKAGVSATDVLNGGLKGALSLAAAGELSVGDAAEVASTAMTQFKLAGKDVGHIADLLAAGAGKAQGDVSDLALGLKQGGLVAAQFGLTIEETVGTMSAFASAGLLGSDAGTSFKQMLLSLANPSVKAAKTMKELGINAYDAQGQFVGIAGLADQLKTKMGGLSDATRQQALAQIFGSDAIRAASILYDQGGQGITDWTTKVNDAGYAAQVAAQRQDNLAGDVNKLKAALTADVINSGGGLNDVLRDITQQATKFVNLVGRIDPSKIEHALGFAAMASGGLLAAAGVGKAAIGISNFQTSLATIATSSPKAAAALGALGKTALTLGAAFVALNIAGQIENNFYKISASSKAAEQALNSLVTGRGADLQAYFADANAGVDLTSSGIDNLATAVGTLGDNHGFTKFANGVTEFFGINTPIKAAREEFEHLDQTLSQMDPAKAQAGFTAFVEQLNKSTDAAHQSRESTDDLINLFPEYAAQLKGVASDMGGLNLSSDELVGWMGGKIPLAVQIAANANPVYKKSLDDVTASMDEQKAAQDALIKGINDGITAMFAARDAALGLRDSQIGLAQSEADAGKAASDLVKKQDEQAKAGKKVTSATNAGKTAFNLHSQAGRDAAKALNSLASQTNVTAQDMIHQGKSAKEVTATMNESRGAFVSAAEKMGLTSKAANKLADESGYSKSAVAALKRQIDALRSKSVTVTTKTSGTSGLYAVQRALDNLHSKTITLTQFYETRGRAQSGRGDTGQAKAAGGPIYGPGTATSDSIAAWLSNGEYVVRAAAVARLGLARLEHINATGTLPGFASGGMVGFASGGSVDISVIERLIRALTAPLGIVGSLTRAVTDASKAAASAKFAVQHPQQNLAVASKAYTTAVNARDNLRISTARGRASDKDQVDKARLALQKLQPTSSKQSKAATALSSAQSALDTKRRAAAESIAKLEDRIDKSKRGSLARKNLENQVDLTRKSNARSISAAEDKVAKARTAANKAGVNSGKIIAAQTKYSKALATQTSNNNKRTLATAEANNKVTVTSKAKTAAEDKYKTAAEKSKDATQALKDASAALAQQQQAIADSAKQVSDSLAANFLMGGTVETLTKNMTEGTAQLKAYNDAIAKLRKEGLSETLVSQVEAQGVRAGTAFASQILAGGKGMVTALNKTQQALQDQADKAGLADATAVTRKASGGYISGPGTGTSDSIHARISNGEYVVNARATAANRQYLDAINYRPGRHYLPSYARGGYVGAGATSTLDHSTRVEFKDCTFGNNPDEIVRAIDRKARLNRYRAGLN